MGPLYRAGSVEALDACSHLANALCQGSELIAFAGQTLRLRAHEPGVGRDGLSEALLPPLGLAIEVSGKRGHQLPTQRRDLLLELRLGATAPVRQNE